MTWRRYLQSRTRNPAFLWRMGIGILLAGMVVGLVVDWAVPAWIHVDAAADAAEPGPEPGPEPDPAAPDWQRLHRLASEGQWLALWRAIPATILYHWRQAGAATLALLTGLCWLAFSLQAIQPRNLRDARFWMPLAAVALGVVSIWPTDFLILWQEHVWDQNDSAELQAGLRDNVLGVGLREELSKFVCFLPLLPPLVWRRDELAALVVAGCVGIGFGMTENISYIAGTGGSATFARLLIPAPLHMAMTGLLGLAAYRACVWPKQCVPQLIAMFVVMVIAHGLYDAFLSIGVLQDYALASSLIFLGLVYQFFRELRPKQKLLVQPISLTANFLFCVSLVAAATFVYLSAAAGWRAAAHVLGNGIAAEGVMVYLFLREMPETMVSV